MASRYQENDVEPATNGTAQKVKARYTQPAVRVPSVAQLRKLAQDRGMELDDDEIEAYRNEMKKSIERINEANELPEPTLPVKYPRTRGFLPPKDENPYNAWNWRCDLCGSDVGKLKGKKIAVKDNIAVAGVPMMNGTYVLEGYTPVFDATVITRVLDAGGRITGKTVCEDLCYSGSSFTGARGPVLNPHDKTRSSGGSSSGNAVAISVGDVDMAVGTDTGGSIRVPAAWCGIVGMKPTYGLVPFTGAVPMDPSIDHLGPMAKTVYDCALLLEVIAGYDNGFDHRQHSSIQVPQYTKEIQFSQVTGERVGILKEAFINSCGDPRVNTLVRETILKLELQGAKVEEVSVPMHKYGSTVFSCFAKEGINDAMLHNGGGGVGHNGYYPSSLMSEFGKAFQARINDLSHRNKLTKLFGAYMKENYQGRYYAKGRNLVLPLRQAYDKVLQEVDVLAFPTIPYTANRLPPEDCSIEEYFSFSSTCAYNTTPFNCTGHPAISIPVGKLDGLPVGLMLVGRHFDEVRLFKVAKAVEQIQRQRDRTPGDRTARL